MPIQIDVSIPIGASGAVGTIAGAYVSSATRLATGMYQIKLQDNYAGYYLGGHQFISPVTGSALAIDTVSAALSVGSAYQITTVGANTDAAWRAIGVPAGVPIAVGVGFVALATGSGASGAGRVKAVATTGSGISKVELISDPNKTIAPVSAVGAGALGSLITIQTLGSSITMGAYTPAGTNSAPALTMNSYTPAGTNNSSTPPIFSGTPATLTGSVAAPAFTGTAASLTGTIVYAPADPANGCTLKLSFLLSNSSVTIGGN